MLFRPGDGIEQAFLYCLAYVANVTRVGIHCYALLSNHHHTPYSDSAGIAAQSRFEAWFHRLFATMVNVRRGRRGNTVFDPSGRPGGLPLLGQRTVRDKLRYTLVQQVRHGLVETLDEWPGLICTPQQMLGEPQVIDRPDWFPSATLPAQVILQLTRPPQFATWTPEQYLCMLERQRVQGVNAWRTARRLAGQSFMGAEAILATDPHSFAKVPFPQRQGRRPIAICDHEDTLELAIALHAQHQIDHDNARLCHLEGGCEPFPQGSIWWPAHTTATCLPGGSWPTPPTPPLVPPVVSEWPEAGDLPEPNDDPPQPFDLTAALEPPVPLPLADLLPRQPASTQEAEAPAAPAADPEAPPANPSPPRDAPPHHGSTDPPDPTGRAPPD